MQFLTRNIILVVLVSPKVKCTPDVMRVEIPISQATRHVYLQGLRDYPEPACKPKPDPSGSLAILELNLNDVYQCATTRVTNKQTVRIQIILLVQCNKTQMNTNKNRLCGFVETKYLI